MVTISAYTSVIVDNREYRQVLVYAKLSGFMIAAAPCATVILFKFAAADGKERKDTERNEPAGATG